MENIENEIQEKHKEIIPYDSLTEDDKLKKDGEDFSEEFFLPGFLMKDLKEEVEDSQKNQTKDLSQISNEDEFHEMFDEKLKVQQKVSPNLLNSENITIKTQNSLKDENLAFFKKERTYIPSSQQSLPSTTSHSHVYPINRQFSSESGQNYNPQMNCYQPNIYQYQNNGNNFNGSNSPNFINTSPHLIRTSPNMLKTSPNNFSDYQRNYNQEIINRNMQHNMYSQANNNNNTNFTSSYFNNTNIFKGSPNSVNLQPMQNNYFIDNSQQSQQRIFPQTQVPTKSSFNFTRNSQKVLTINNLAIDPNKPNLNPLLNSKEGVKPIANRFLSSQNVNPLRSRQFLSQFHQHLNQPTMKKSDEIKENITNKRVANNPILDNNMKMKVAQNLNLSPPMKMPTRGNFSMPNTPNYPPYSLIDIRSPSTKNLSPSSITEEPVKSKKSKNVKSSKKQKFPKLSHFLKNLPYKLPEYVCKKKGSRVIERYLTNEDSNVKIILGLVVGHFAKIMSDTYGNYFFQKLVGLCNLEQRMNILNEVMGQLFTIATSQFGTHSVQALITKSNDISKEISILEKSLINNFIILALDNNATFVVQTFLEYIPEEQRSSLNIVLVENIEKLLYNSNGAITVSII